MWPCLNNDRAAQGKTRLSLNKENSIILDLKQGFLFVQPFSHAVDLVGEQSSDVFNLNSLACIFKLTWTLNLVDKFQNWSLTLNTHTPS